MFSTVPLRSNPLAELPTIQQQFHVLVLAGGFGWVDRASTLPSCTHSLSPEPRMVGILECE